MAPRPRPISIHGDGEQTRDFIYVTDVVNFLCAGMNLKIKSPELFNVCTGHATSINELAAAIADAAQRKPEIQNASPRSGDIRLSCGDPSKALAVLGLEATTSLKAGLRDTLEYIAISINKA